MARLSAVDYDGALHAIHAVAEASTREEFATLALAEVATLLASDISSLNEVDPAADRLGFVSDPVDVPYAADAPLVFARLADTHPLIRHYADTGDGSAVKISDFWTVDVWHASDLYREFYRPLGVEHQMSITLPAPLPIVVAIAVNRRDADADFDERDRAVLNLLRPHLAQAWRRAREHERLARLTGAAAGALSATDSLVLVLEDPPHELTAGALTALYRYFGRPGARDPLPARVRRWLDEQRARPPDALAHPLTATRDGRRVVVRHLPALRGAAEALLLDEGPARTSPRSLRDLGLTEREAQVLALVVSGVTNAAIAAELSLSPWTVKRHLANSYAKMGVRGRVAATAMVLEIIGHHSWPGSGA